jgi:HD-GYP domain-containing protein (c-di-GMP phosphodiesterase class II)
MEFVPINVSTLRAGVNFPFNLFLRVNEKHLLYIRSGDDIDEKRLVNLMSEGVSRIFIQNEEFNIYSEYLYGQIDEAVESESMPVEQKVVVVEGAAINAVDTLETLIDDPQSEAAYELTLKAAKGLRKVVNKNPDALKKIYSQRGRNHDKILSHCKNVCALATRFAFLEGFKNEELDQLGAAALLHDIGLNKLNRDDQQTLFKKNTEKFTPDDKRIYHSHVESAIKMLKDRKYVNNKILKLISIHEEKQQGNGYPKQIQKLEPIEEILSLVNCFDKKISVFGMDPSDAYQELFEKEIGHYDLDLMKRLKKALTDEGIL